MKYIISGVALTGNKGASGMAESLMQNLRIRQPESSFFIFSYYPKSDRALLKEKHAELLDGSPKKVVILFFLCLWAFLGRIIHLPRKCYAWGEMRKIAECGLWLDASGISFVDGREKFLIFNILSILPAFALGIPVIKVSQAMGPFNNLINRLAAKAVLPRLKLIVARGNLTRSYLDELKLDNVINAPDVAFALHTTQEDQEQITRFLSQTGKKVIGISPSQVVWKLCDSQNVPYLEILKKCIEEWTADGFECVVFPHSIRKNTEKTHNNDLPLIKKFAAMLPQSPDIRIIEEELSAGELRLLIASFHVLVASRFHAIISAMAVGVPAVVIGWSHKYAEALAPFQLEELVVPYDSLSEEAVMRRVSKVIEKHKKYTANIHKKMAIIQKGNECFFNLLEMKVPCHLKEKS